MKLGVVKRVDKADLAKSAKDDKLPAWVDALLNPINEFIEKVGQSLQNQLTFRDNFLGKVVELNFTHDIEQELNPYPGTRGSLRVSAVYPATTGSLFITGFKWKPLQNGNIGVTFQFTGGTEASIRLHIHLE
jgi:hypothetical protein